MAAPEGSAVTVRAAVVGAFPELDAAEVAALIRAGDVAINGTAEHRW